jgi:hypothetical protein
MILTDGNGVDYSGSVQVAGCCEDRNETSGFINCREFLDGQRRF